MFTDKDYSQYLIELQNLIKDSVMINTDLLNGLRDLEIHNKLSVVLTEDMQCFRELRTQIKNLKQ